MLNVFSGQVSVPVRSTFTLVPAALVLQKEAPAEEYSPGPSQGAQDPTDPDIENVPAGQGTSADPSQ